MNWDMKTATGREKLLIRERKLTALYQIRPDLMAAKPYSFLPYMAEDCVLRSERLPEPLAGGTIMDFLAREKRTATGFGPSPATAMAESEDDGEILLRIRPRHGGEEAAGELVQLELDAAGKVCEIRRFEENRRRYRTFSTSVTLTPGRLIREEGKRVRGEQDREEAVSFSSLYYDTMALIFTILPECPMFEEMEERNMEISDWTAILGLWKEINGDRDFRTLRDRVFEAEAEYLRKDRGYGEELEDLVRGTLETRDPYGRRMQAWMEEWLNGCKDRYDYIRKC